LEHYDATHEDAEKVDGAGTLIISVDPEDEISIAEVVQHIAHAFDFDNDILYDASQPDGQFKKTADNTKFKNLYGYKPPMTMTPIKWGIKETVQWFVQHYYNARK
jgi:GDP-L-fucose synthase